MGAVLDWVSNSVWHAFNSLDSHKTGNVQKTRLKVLAANFGTVLNCYGVEKGLDDFRSTSYLSFEHFRYYLQKEVFCIILDTSEWWLLSQYQDQIEEVCWLVYHTTLLKRQGALLPTHSVFHLFRVFCLLGEEISDPATQISIVLSSDEVELLLYRFTSVLGTKFDAMDFRELSKSLTHYTFPVFLTLLESRYGNGLEEGALKEAVQELYDTYVKDILKKGCLSKRGELLPAFREYWFQLQPHVLTYFNGRDKKGDIPIMASSRVELATDPTRFLLYSNDRVYELQATDQKTKLQWMSALRIAIDHCSGDAPSESHQRKQMAIRWVQRENQKIKMQQERERRRSQIALVQQTQAELQAEKQARVAAEDKAAQLEEAREVDSKRIKDMEVMQIQLQTLLEEETQQKRDEEIVRNLQARLLKEEWEKKEEMEKLQAELKAMLVNEIKIKEELKHKQRDKEQQLLETKEKLRLLETDRQRVGEDLLSYQKKIAQSEKNKEFLESRLKEYEGVLHDRNTLLPGRNVPTRHESLLRPVRDYRSVFRDDYKPSNKTAK